MQRYRDMIPDWECFWETIQRPLPPTFRANPLRIEPCLLEERLRAQGWVLARRAWNPLFFEVLQGPPPGATLEHWLGYYYVQEETSLFPPLALEPQPGERILDLCAAPGGKTSYIAYLMNNRGLLVANDPDSLRLKALMPNLFRLGVLCAVVTEYRGEQFPLPSGPLFDRVLVDAPCTSEGNVRRSFRLLPGAPLEAVRRMSSLQKGLLRRAVELTKPGGVIVYSTCTFAPEENEEVVRAVLNSHPVSLEWLEFPVPHERGLTEWGGRELGKEMQACVRFYPHHFNSGGGFVARLRKSAE